MNSSIPTIAIIAGAGLLVLAASTAAIAADSAATPAETQSQPPTTQTQPALPSVEEIVNNTNRVSYYQGSDGRARVKMTIVDSQDRTRNRELTILRWDEPAPEQKTDPAADTQPAESTATKPAKGDDSYTGEQRFYVFFHRPADVNRTAFMVWKHLDSDDDRWMYYPANDVVKRIASSEKRTSFVGSHYFYEDVSGRNINLDDHELVKATDNFFILKNTPKNPDDVEFGHYIMYIHRPSYVVLRTEYYDKQDKKYRQYDVDAKAGVKFIQGYPTVVKSTMRDLRTGGYTVLEYSDVKYDIGLEQDIFTERYLRRPPYKFLK